MRADDLDPSAEPDTEPDWLAIEFVCQGTAMKLHPADRPEAIRRLAPRLTTGQIAKRIDCPDHIVTRIAKQLGVKPQSGQIRWHAPQSAAA